MVVSGDTKAKILADHYLDTCVDVREKVKKRGRFLLYVVVVMWAHCLRLSGDTSPEPFKFFTKWVSPPVEIDGFWLDALLCFVLFGVVIGYAQVNVYINKQYKYLHETEKKFDHLLEAKMIRREGSHYLSSYPLFSSWVHKIYTWDLPLFLILSISIIIYQYYSKYGLNLITMLFFFLPLTITVLSSLLYLISLKCKVQDE